jgi:hypothetical protein
MERKLLLYPIVAVSLVFIFISIPLSAVIAQDCSKELLLQKPGKWKAGIKGSEGGTPADLAKEKKIVSAIHNMITAKYSPLGVEAGYQGAFGRPQPNTPANDYYYSIIPLNYYCDGNSLKTAHESSTYFQVSANFPFAEIYESPDISQATSGTGYHSISDMPVEKNGIWIFKETDASLGFGMTGKSSAWLITYAGKLPYSYVTKKEFLENRKKILANSMMESSNGFKDVLKRIEIEKGFKEKEYKNDPEKLKKYMKMDYSDTKARYEKLLADIEKTYQPAFAKIEALLKLPATELNRQAIVKADPADHLSYLFTDDTDPFGKILIKPNPGYFNIKLPRSSPQFFGVQIKGNHKEPIAAKFMTDIMKAVDFTILKNMLGK